MNVVAHIVPTVPPEFNGLGDYCYQLWKHWPDPKPEWHGLAARLPEGAKAHWPEVNLRSFDLNREDLVKQVLATKANTVVLHYVGYAYAKRGAPSWLPRALEDWKRLTQGNVVTMFHELYASGPPWKSEFWLRSKQVRIVRELIGLSERWITSCPEWERRLMREFGGDPSKGKRIPIGSNIDPVRGLEHKSVFPFPEEGLKIACFGFPGTRLRSLSTHQNLLTTLGKQGMIDRIVLLGRSPDDETTRKIKELLTSAGLTKKVEEVYDATSETISEALLGCHIGLMYYPYGILTKSGVHAAYAVHGLTTLIPSSKESGSGPFLTNEDANPSPTIVAIEKLHSSVDAPQYLFTNVAKEFAREVGLAHGVSSE